MKDIALLIVAVAAAVVLCADRPEAQAEPVAPVQVAAPVVDETPVTVETPAVEQAAAPATGYSLRRGGPLVQGDKGECLPQPGDMTMIPEYLDRPGVIDGHGKASPFGPQANSSETPNSCPCGPGCSCSPCRCGL